MLLGHKVFSPTIFIKRNPWEGRLSWIMNHLSWAKSWSNFKISILWCKNIFLLLFIEEILLEGFLQECISISRRLFVLYIWFFRKDILNFKRMIHCSQILFNIFITLTDKSVTRLCSAKTMQILNVVYLLGAR